jgi:hypothetical protein
MTQIETKPVSKTTWAVAGPMDDTRIANLVAEVYDSAPAAERGRLLEHLLRPLGVLSLVAIAGGVFAGIRFRSGWQPIRIPVEELQYVRAADVAALVDHTQQVCVEAVDGLAQILMGSPVLAGSAAAVMLITALLQRAQRHPPRFAEAPVAGRAAS